MGWIAKDLPTLIFLLLPGFIAAAIYYTLTAHPKTSEFERVIQSLIFTTIIRVLVIPLKLSLLAVGRVLSLGRWDADTELMWSVILALAVGLLFALFANRDGFHWLMRRAGLSTRTSYPSEWYSAFARFARIDRFVVLHLDGDRRLYGKLDEWPDQPDRGHFLIVGPKWVLDDNQFAPLSA